MIVGQMTWRQRKQIIKQKKKFKKQAMISY